MDQSIKRCPWVNLKNPIYVNYHDQEWGVPVHDDAIHFEFLVLESAQAGLSWETVLNKRENYRRLFANFDAQKVARFSEEKIEKLLLDPGIIRNRLKVKAAVTNAQAFLKIQKEFGSFTKYIWSFVGGKSIHNHLKSIKDYQPRTPESDALSADLKKRGFKFVGSTIMYAHMQATGLVNDHIEGCFCLSKSTPSKKIRISKK
jgi:DNA-3-methyladenine glycosylase I